MLKRFIYINYTHNTPSSREPEHFRTQSKPTFGQQQKKNTQPSGKSKEPTLSAYITKRAYQRVNTARRGALAEA